MRVTSPSLLSCTHGPQLIIYATAAKPIEMGDLKSPILDDRLLFPKLNIATDPIVLTHLELTFSYITLHDILSRTDE
jgi:hypothetical protein